jgi:hypothetical protein
VNARWTSSGFAVLAIALVLAQDVRPGPDLYHTWQYAAVLALAIAFPLAYAWRAARGRQGRTGRLLALAFLGAAVVAGGGLASGLLGPDTITVRGVPGTVVPVPDIGAAAFFSPADEATIASGDGSVTLRSRGAEPVVIAAHDTRFLAMAIAYLEPSPAAYVTVRDADGRHLTVTQPQSTTFLSPVLLFPATQRIAQTTYPLDTFAAPSLHRVAHALFFTAEQAAAFPRGGKNAPGVLLSVDDDAGRTAGLGLAISGVETQVGGMRVSVTAGSYPRLRVASAPPPLVLAGGVALFLLGLVMAVISMMRPTRSESAQTQPTA